MKFILVASLAGLIVPAVFFAMQKTGKGSKKGLQFDVKKALNWVLIYTVAWCAIYSVNPTFKKSCNSSCKEVKEEVVAAKKKLFSLKKKGKKASGKVAHKNKK